MNAGIFTMHWENIDPMVPYYQKRVFDHFQLPIFQHKIDGIDHGEWMDWVLRRNEDLETVVFFDIDCIPLDASKTMDSITKAMGGTLIGNEQASNSPDDNRYLSEDYHFSDLARANGFRIWAAPWARLTHTGTYIFSGELMRSDRK